MNASRSQQVQQGAWWLSSITWEGYLYLDMVCSIGAAVMQSAADTNHLRVPCLDAEHCAC